MGNGKCMQLDVVHAEMEGVHKIYLLSRDCRGEYAPILQYHRSLTTRSILIGRHKQ
jgi:hypothetical protein